MIMQCNFSTKLSFTVGQSNVLDILTCPHTPSHVFQFHLEERLVWMCKLGVISQERLKIDAKLLLSADRKPYMPHRLA